MGRRLFRNERLGWWKGGWVRLYTFLFSDETM